MPAKTKDRTIKGIGQKNYVVKSVGNKLFVNVPLDDYETLLSRNENLRDKIAFLSSIEKYGEGFPGDVMKRLNAEENPIKVLREWRGLTQENLAKEIESKASYISQLETGNRDGSLLMMAAIAEALDVLLDDLVSYYVQ